MRKTSIALKPCARSARDERASGTISRRSFLGSSALVVLPVLCGGCTDDGPPIVDLPPVTGKNIVVPLAQFAALANVGGSILGQSAGYPDPIVIAHVHDNQFVAADAVCTHMHCFVGYNALNLTYDCPCHGSTYEVDGRVIGGPAPRPLTTFTVQSDGTNVTITLP